MDLRSRVAKISVMALFGAGLVLTLLAYAVSLGLYSFG
jgi:hypothetical protein